MRSTGVIPPRLALPLALVGLAGFVGSLAYFVQRYFTDFGGAPADASRLGPAAFDVALFSVFALHHSLFAREGVRQWVTRSVGALERSAYVWVASALFMGVCAAWQPVAGVVWRIQQPLWTTLLGAVQVTGILISIWGASLIDVRELAGLRQIEAVTTSKATGPSAPPEFVARGPYGWVRHPIYAAWFLIVFAVPVMTMTRLVFALTSALYLLVAIPLEERSLHRAAPDGYARYTHHVRWRLLPGLY